ncbi:LuxR C-terminal-related transcriptional regulator [Serratia sp. L9]|uniref:LuxR C-terminal-related transcriptional regulator n=1 Tax=Serratia sp. L9 TaxID=3423946 RepID=UPI003D664C7C
MVIVGLHDQYNNVLTRYLAGLRNVCVIFDISTPLDVLLREITALIKDHIIEKKVLPTVLFSTRESIIMQGILNGQSMNRISSHLDIDYKTVSHYKRSALGKFGIRSLQPLLTGGFVKNCPY